LFFSSILLLGAAIVLFYYASVFKNDPILGIIGYVADFDIQNALMISCIVIGCFILVLMFCGMCIAWKRYCCIQFFYILLLSIAVLFFIVIGAILVVIAGYAKDALTDACADPDGDLSEAFSSLYSTADSFYCVQDSGFDCRCEPVTFDTTDGQRSAAYEQVSGGITKVQQCTDQILDAFSDYAIDLSSITDAVEYFDYFGDIEDGYSCSGICLYEAVYYYHSFTAGKPKKACLSNIKSDLIEGTIEGSGIAFIVTGCFAFVIWFIQYGLCCRKNLNGQKNPGAGASKNF
jgi:uncharacterized membrane protein (Fun14 family)